MAQVAALQRQVARLQAGEEIESDSLTAAELAAFGERCMDCAWGQVPGLIPEHCSDCGPEGFRSIPGGVGSGNAEITLHDRWTAKPVQP